MLIEVPVCMTVFQAALSIEEKTPLADCSKIGGPDPRLWGGVSKSGPLAAGILGLPSQGVITMTRTASMSPQETAE